MSQGLEAVMSVSSEERAPGRRLRVERGIYQQPNGRYAVCFMVDGRPRFRTVGFDLDAAREERAALIEAGRWGMVPVEPQLRFGRVAGWWIARYERKVAAGERRERTLENHRYNLDRHLLPALDSCLMRAITVEDVAELLTGLRAQGRSEKTMAGALATLHSIVRFAIRTAGSSRTLSQSWRSMSARTLSVAASASSAAMRSAGSWRRVRRATDR
jgi:hypothetical protein